MHAKPVHVKDLKKPAGYKKRVASKASIQRALRKAAGLKGFGMKNGPVAQATGVPVSVLRDLLDEPSVCRVYEQAKLRLRVLTQDALDVYARRMQQMDDAMLAREVLQVNGLFPQPASGGMEEGRGLTLNVQQAQGIMGLGSAPGAVSASSPLLREVVRHFEHNASAFDVGLDEREEGEAQSVRAGKKSHDADNDE